jgi:hypothetical protein
MQITDEINWTSNVNIDIYVDGSNTDSKYW